MHYALFVAFALYLFTAVAQTQSLFIREGFERVDQNTWMLLPCHRPENIIAVSIRAISGNFAVRLEVKPLRDSRVLPSYPFVVLPALNCLSGDKPKSPVADQAERAEVWTPKSARLPVDADIWYGFSMLIAGEVSDDEPRLVIGQWKQSNGRSPIIAQRFNHKTFRITIEQDGSEGFACRILVAYQHDRPKPQDDSFLHEGSGANENIGGCMSKTEVIAPNGAFGPAATLANPFQGLCWIDMIYHVRGSSQRNGLLQPDGLLEIWANEASIASVNGRIGYYSDDLRTRDLYFKFGPPPIPTAIILRLPISTASHGVRVTPKSIPPNFLAATLVLHYAIELRGAVDAELALPIAAC
jgi:hypothetical protein